MKEATYRERASEDVQARYQRAIELLDHDRFEEAEPILRTITEDEPGFAPAYNKLGVLHIRRKNRDEARAQFEEAISVDWEYAPALTNLGNMALQGGNKFEAMRYYERAIDADYEYGPAHNSLGVLLRQQGRYGEAVRHLRLARRKKSYHVSPDELSSPAGRRGCVFLAVAVAAVLFGLFFLLLR